MRVWMWALVALCLFGCGAPSDWVKLDVPKEPVESGWTTLSNTEAGISLNVPPGWESDNGLATRSLEIGNRVRKLYPGASVMDGDSGEADLMAIDMSQDGLDTGTLRTLEVQVVPVSDLKDFDIGTLRLPPGQQNMTGPEIRETKIGRVAVFNRAELMDNLKSNAKSTMITRIFVFGREKCMWLLTISFPAENEAKFKPILDKIIASVRVSETTVARAEAAREKRNRAESKTNTQFYKQEAEEQKAIEDERNRQAQLQMQIQREKEQEEMRRNQEALRNLPENQLPQDEGPSPSQAPPPQSQGNDTGGQGQGQDNQAGGQAPLENPGQ